MRITVFGAGAWGSALALAFAREHEVRLWGREPADLQQILATRTNPRYLPGVLIPDNIGIEPDFARAARGAELHLIATPLSALGATVERLQQEQPNTPLLWACKGLETSSGRLPHEIVAARLGEHSASGVLTGPTFAAEVARGLPTAAVIGALDADFAHHWVQALHQPLFRLYANTDLVGVEIGGAVKNVMAIAAGVCDGLGFGLNTRAALITRGLAEISRLGEALGARRETFMGLAGMGDLILTCTGDLSRNRRVGLGLASGKSLQLILDELGQVAEGVNSAAAICELAIRHGVEMPICNAVNALLEERLSAMQAVELLLSRDPGEE